MNIECPGWDEGSYIVSLYLPEKFFPSSFEKSTYTEARYMQDAVGKIDTDDRYQMYSFS